MRVRRFTALSRSWIVATLVGALVLATVAAPAPAGADVLDPSSPGLSIGTLNTNLQPWLPSEDAVVDTVRQTHFDVLALQGVFSQRAADRITGDPAIAARYGYSYFVPGKQQQAAPITSVPRNEMENYINCLIGRGVDTTTAVQPTTQDPACDFLGQRRLPLAAGARDAAGDHADVAQRPGRPAGHRSGSRRQRG